MQKKSLYITTYILFVSFLSGCGDSNIALPEGETEQIPIAFSTQRIVGANEGQSKTRATGTSFPNASIAIVAASKTTTTGNPVIGSGTTINNIDWSTAEHWSATAANEAADGTHVITLNPATYWPFNPDEYLAFTAYSPAIHGTMKKKGDTGTDASLTDTQLQVKVDATNKSFPDLLYLEKVNGKDYNAVGPFNKTKDVVALGKFHHALAKIAKITVKCVYFKKPDTDIPEADYAKLNISISSLTIGTKVTQGTFDFFKPTGWTLSTPEATTHTLYTLVSSKNVLTKAHEITGSYYLLPDTQDNSQVSITLQDGTVDHTYTQTISAFKAKSADGGTDTSITLEQEKQVELTIKIKVMNVSIGDSEDNVTIKLEGSLTDWIDKGNGDVTIN